MRKHLDQGSRLPKVEELAASSERFSDLSDSLPGVVAQVASREKCNCVLEGPELVAMPDSLRALQPNRGPKCRGRPAPHPASAVETELAPSLARGQMVSKALP